MKKLIMSVLAAATPLVAASTVNAGWMCKEFCRDLVPLCVNNCF